MNSFSDAIAVIKEHVDKYKNDKDIEFEFRLGYIDDTEDTPVFKTNIGEEFFTKITNKLNKSNIWDTKKKLEINDFFLNGRRLSMFSDGTSNCIKKNKIAIFDFKVENTGFDIRVSISKEIPSNKFQTDKAEYKRLKIRNSLLYKNWSYDLTKVESEENTVQTTSYEVELESKHTDFTKISSRYLIHDGFIKLIDLIKICENIENPILTLVNSKIN